MRLLASLAAATFVIGTAACSSGERVFRIPASSMEPTLHCAHPGAGCEADEMDRIRVRVDSTLERGDMIAFQTPPGVAEACGGEGVFVKRVIGLPGETWSERSGFIYINGHRIREPYVKTDRRDSETIPARKIPARSYFVLGDNRVASCDSRRWGYVRRKNVIGKVVLIVRGDRTIKVR